MKRTKTQKKILDNALMSSAVVLSAYVPKISVDAAYEKLTGSEAPRNPKQPGVSWRRALLWPATTGALLGVAKTAMRPKIDSGVNKLLSS